MKKFLMIVGGIFLALVLVVSGMVAYLANQGRALDNSSKAYVDESVPIIVAKWSKDELISRASPQLLEIVNKNPEQFDALFQKLKSLGGLRSYGGAEGQSNVFYGAKEGKVVAAEYRAKASFENGEAEVFVRLIQISGEWQYLNFHVSAPIFLQ